MGKKTELETELAEIQASLEGADNDEIRDQLNAKIAEIQTALETATDEEELEDVADDLERLKTWAQNELGVPLTEIRQEMATMREMLEKLARKIKTAKPAEPEPEPAPKPEPLPEPEPKPQPKPEPEPEAKPQRSITRL